MEILPGIEIIDLALYIKPKKTLILADLHLGYEEFLRESGCLIPEFQYEKITGHLNEIFAQIEVETVIINGDLKHEFGRISRQEWSEVLDFLDFLSGNCEEVILIRGNHDTIAGPIADKKNVGLRNHYFFDDLKVYVSHGHKIPDDRDFHDSEIVIIAHDHPAIGLREELRVEKVKCFLCGSWGDKRLIVMPSFNFVTEGVDVLQESLLSPFLHRDLSRFDAYAVEEAKVLYFGELSRFY
ncbi:MAG: hypothetical protein A7316_09390 [Candidatus Altiarchaeales archaeon WOR_SM1_86-2]|nr:MAG: hypothetical protein A7316_09390 [Candidatus Altiarchaeales archaeon WOR_SM1_86-2]ODS41077.1 MAG: hypothetical protein A7315_07095 [Candidatus Altiarchaeales archaeon WOR_SM1_79]